MLGNKAKINVELLRFHLTKNDKTLENDLNVLRLL
jgi:hypothetical protein